MMSAAVAYLAHTAVRLSVIVGHKRLSVIGLRHKRLSVIGLGGAKLVKIHLYLSALTFNCIILSRAWR